MENHVQHLLGYLDPASSIIIIKLDHFRGDVDVSALQERENSAVRHPTVFSPTDLALGTSYDSSLRSRVPIALPAFSRRRYHSIAMCLRIP